MNEARRQQQVNDLIIAIFKNDNEAENLLRIVLEQDYDSEFAAEAYNISKMWLYDKLSGICGISTRSAFNKVNGITQWRISEIEKIKNFFNGEVSLERISKYLNILKEITKNEK